MGEEETITLRLTRVEAGVIGAVLGHNTGRRSATTRAFHVLAGFAPDEEEAAYEAMQKLRGPLHYNFDGASVTAAAQRVTQGEVAISNDEETE